MSESYPPTTQSGERSERSELYKFIHNTELTVGISQDAIKQYISGSYERYDLPAIQNLLDLNGKTFTLAGLNVAIKFALNRHPFKGLLHDSILQLVTPEYADKIIEYNSHF
jgi:hypothetical protein